MDMVGQHKIENYLRLIYKYQKLNGRARGVDIASALDVTRPTVCTTLKKLEDYGYIRLLDDSGAVLTEKGTEIAAKISERYDLFHDMLIKLNVDRKIAEADACQLEHELSDEGFNAIKEFVSDKLDTRKYKENTKELKERSMIFRALLESLGIDGETAEKESKKLASSVSKESFEALVYFFRSNYDNK